METKIEIILAIINGVAAVMNYIVDNPFISMLCSFACGLMIGSITH